MRGEVTKFDRGRVRDAARGTAHSCVSCFVAKYTSHQPSPSSRNINERFQEYTGKAKQTHHRRRHNFVSDSFLKRPPSTQKNMLKTPCTSIAVLSTRILENATLLGLGLGLRWSISGAKLCNATLLLLLLPLLLLLLLLLLLATLAARKANLKLEFRV